LALFTQGLRLCFSFVGQSVLVRTNFEVDIFKHLLVGEGGGGRVLGGGGG